MPPPRESGSFNAGNIACTRINCLEENMKHLQSLNIRIVLTACGLAVLAATAPADGADPSIVVGSHNLLPNTAGQPVQIRVENVPDVAGVKLNAQIEDGSGIGTPRFSGVDLITGTIFTSNADAWDNGTTPGLLIYSILTPPGTVSASAGLLATLYVDTTGFNSGTFVLSLGDTLNGATTFLSESGEVPIIITNGTLTVVPEPSGLAILVTGLIPLLRRRRN